MVLKASFVHFIGQHIWFTRDPILENLGVSILKKGLSFREGMDSFLRKTYLKTNIP